MTPRLTLPLLLLSSILFSACEEGASTPSTNPAGGETTPTLEGEITEPPVGTAEGDDPAAPAPVVEQDPESELPAPDISPLQRADEQRRARAEDLFGEVIKPLNEAAEAYQDHDELDRSSFFSKDQKDNLENINELLDGVIDSLGVSELADTRSKLRLLEEEIRGLEKQRLEDREARLGAPTKEELNRLQRVYTMSREEYDDRIEEAGVGIAARKREIDAKHVEFVQQMRGLGLDIDMEGARSLLATVTGDDFVEMCVVLDNVRGLTLQLQALTEESGESLEAARRYYGAYVMLVRLMDRVQKSFIHRSLEEMVPRLEELSVEAEKLIDEARDNIRKGGDRTILDQNIQSNKLTIDATALYAEYLRGQASEIQARNDALQTTLRDAENTFDTVSLSSQVAAILREGQRNFAALLQLDLPPLRGFENAELQKEFKRLTEQMSGIQ